MKDITHFRLIFGQFKQVKQAYLPTHSPIHPPTPTHPQSSTANVFFIIQKKAFLSRLVHFGTSFTNHFKIEILKLEIVELEKILKFYNET